MLARRRLPRTCIQPEASAGDCLPNLRSHGELAAEGGAITSAVPRVDFRISGSARDVGGSLTPAVWYASTNLAIAPCTMIGPIDASIPLRIRCAFPNAYA